MTRRASFLRRGATEVVILALDLEHYLSPGRGLLEGVINAYSVASAQNLPNLQFYGYTQARCRGFAKEYLLPCCIPKEAVVGWIPASGQSRDIPIHLGTLRVPEALLAKVRGVTEFAIKEWVKEEIYTLTGAWNAQMVQRLMRAMCVEAWD